MPDFKKFSRTTAPVTTEPFFTVHKNWRVVSLNHAAYLSMDQPEAVELLFDESEKVLGVRKVATSDPDAFLVRKQGNARNYVIAAQAFAHHFGLQSAAARRYAPKLLESGLLAVDLKEAGVEATRSKARA